MLTYELAIVFLLSDLLAPGHEDLKQWTRRRSLFPRNLFSTMFHRLGEVMTARSTSLVDTGPGSDSQSANEDKGEIPSEQACSTFLETILVTDNVNLIDGPFSLEL